MGAHPVVVRVVLACQHCLIFSAIVKVIFSVSNISVSNAVGSSIVARILVSNSDIVTLLILICSNAVRSVAAFLSLRALSLSSKRVIFPKTRVR